MDWDHAAQFIDGIGTLRSGYPLDGYPFGSRAQPALELHAPDWRAT